MQWTGIVTSIAIEMLESGKVDAVVCVQSEENDRFSPKPVRKGIAWALSLPGQPRLYNLGYQILRCCIVISTKEATSHVYGPFLGSCIDSSCVTAFCNAAQVVARSKADILAAKGVKPTLSPNLDVLATVEALDVKRLLFIGVGCQVKLPRSPRGPNDY